MIANYRTYQLPWELAQDQDEHFRKLLKQALIAAAAFAIVLPLLPVSQPDPDLVQEPPPRFARLLLEKPVPPPLPPAPVIEPPPQVRTEPVPVAPKSLVQTPKPEVVTAQPQEQARQTAANRGPLVMPAAEQDVAAQVLVRGVVLLL